MFRIDESTCIIDTPGIKEWGIIELGDDTIAHCFPEFRALLGDCKFYNCTHLHEPGCKVLQGVESGQIAESRYFSYVSIITGEDNRR
jgi:ribosome biogenesis GTPase